MDGAEEVVAGIERRPGVEYSGLALNARGYARLAASGLDLATFNVAATDAFSRRNAGAPVADALAAAEAVLAEADRPVSISVSVAWGCPFEGEVDPGAVEALVERLVAAGAAEVVLADTIGVATPGRVRRLLERVSIHGVPVGGHFHDTRRTGVANAWAALEAGATVLDASVGGFGGCPFAPNATGNVATEDVVYALEREGVATGVDLDALIEVARWLAGRLGREPASGVAHAGAF
jgi:isopropylmalate/homocitrate/citramalate synthase